MESANIHNPLCDYQFVGSTSSLATTTHAWNTTSSMASTNNSSLSSSSYYPNFETSMAHSYTSSNYWSNPNLVGDQSAEDLQISSIKAELSDIYNLNYIELISSSPSSTSNDQESSRFIRPEQGINRLKLLPNDHHQHHHLNTNKLLLKPLTSVNKGYNTQVFPTSVRPVGFSSSHGPSLDMNLEALDLLSSSRFSRRGSFMINDDSSFENQMGMFGGGFAYGFGHHIQQQQPHHHFIPIHKSINSKILSSSRNGAAEAKRDSSKMDPSKPVNQTSTKKPRTSCPPLKVRKEKLGDRIAALQQLVAPFGKTDTASVLMEAIGYIKFLQSQVETLSVPYMKGAHIESRRSIKEGHMGNKEQGEKGPKCDLKSRGLCLVPMSCLSYIAEGGGAWPQPHYGGNLEF